MDRYGDQNNNHFYGETFSKDNEDSYQLGIIHKHLAPYGSDRSLAIVSEFKGARLSSGQYLQIQQPSNSTNNQPCAATLPVSPERYSMATGNQASPPLSNTNCNRQAAGLTNYGSSETTDHNKGPNQRKRKKGDRTYIAPEQKVILERHYERYWDDKNKKFRKKMRIEIARETELPTHKALRVETVRNWYDNTKRAKKAREKKAREKKARDKKDSNNKRTTPNNVPFQNNESNMYNSGMPVVNQIVYNNAGVAVNNADYLDRDGLMNRPETFPQVFDNSFPDIGMPSINIGSNAGYAEFLPAVDYNSQGFATDSTGFESTLQTQDPCVTPSGF